MPRENGGTLYNAGMASVGLLSLIAVFGLSIVLVLLASRWGAAIAFVRLCWIPLATVLLVLVLKDRLGLEILLLLATVLFVTVGFVATGMTLAVAAVRRRSPSARSLIWGTLIAAAPLLLVAAPWVVQAFRRHP